MREIERELYMVGVEENRRVKISVGGKVGRFEGLGLTEYTRKNFRLDDG